jgi:hypothetical protein
MDILSIFVAIAVADLTKFLHDMMLYCKYQQFIVNKYLWIQKVENRHSYPNIHLQTIQGRSVSTETHSRQDNQSFITGSKGVLSFLLHPDQLWYLSMCLHQTVFT